MTLAGDHGDQGRINAAAEPNEDPLESALGHVILCAHHEASQNRFLL
jgi:hypothetical protein